MKTGMLLFSITALAVYGFNVNHENSHLYKKAIEKTIGDYPLLAPIQVRPKPHPGLNRGVGRSSAERLQGPPNYWFHSKIHTFGNTGLLGAIHAAIAPLATRLIDITAYDGENVRVGISRDLRKRVGKTGANVADLCCGVGISTRALRCAFSDANALVGIDTSPEMISMAQLLSEDSIVSRIIENQQPLQGGCDASYVVANAEQTSLPPNSFDLVTVMYGFHEIPFLARYCILREARRLLVKGGTLAIVDISPNYEPSPAMLAGEPYVLEYKKNIHAQLASVQGFMDLSFKEVVPGHVGLWLLTRKEKPSPGVPFIMEQAAPRFNLTALGV